MRAPVKAIAPHARQGNRLWHPFIFGAVLRYLKRKDLDAAAWDACVEAACTVPYGRSWFLDIATDYHWDALVYGDYAAVFPLPWRQRLGIKEVLTPLFCQQLGIFSAPSCESPALTDWLNAIPEHFRRVRLQIRDAQSPLPDGWHGKERPNVELDLNHDYDTIASGYSDNLKRNLKRAAKAGLAAEDILYPAEFIRLFRTHQGPQIPEVKGPDYQRLGRILAVADHRREHQSYRIYHPDQPRQTLASVFFWMGPRGPVYLAGSSTPEGRSSGAMAYAFDQLIRDCTHENRAGYEPKSTHHMIKVLDFEGSSRPGLARFFGSFGAVPKPYRAVHMARFPLIFSGFEA